MTYRQAKALADFLCELGFDAKAMPSIQVEHAYRVRIQVGVHRLMFIDHWPGKAIENLSGQFAILHGSDVA